MEGLLAALEALFDERKQHSILIIRTIETCAEVTLFAEH
jgi:hypothetical protein